MATQEERLQIVEFDLKHFKTETIKAYGEVAMELVMVKGLAEDAVKRLIGVRRTLDEHTVLLHNQGERLDRLETTLSEHTTVLNEHTARFDRLETTLDEHTARFDRLETTLAQILTRLPEKP
jgi:septal ring factor EnvC (AmiA/AmiB activator)